MKILLLLLASIPVLAQCPAHPSNGYQYCREIVINHLLVPSTLSNFPVGICFGTVAGPNCSTNNLEFATQSNGGRLTNASGFDFIFTSDSAGATPIAYERVIQNLITGTAEMWVKIASLSSSVDTKIYLWYHNNSITTDQSNGSAVWDSDFLGVHHMQLVSGTYTILIPSYDSTANANNLDLQGQPVAIPVNGVTSGVIGGAADFITGGAFTKPMGPYTNFPPNAGPAPFTLEGWFNVNGATNEGSAYCFGGNAAVADRWSLEWNVSHWGIEGQNVFVSFTGAETGWHHIVAILPSGQATYINGKIYVDGTLKTLTNNLNGNATFAPQYNQNAYTSGQACGLGVVQAPVLQFPGLVDDLRLSKIERSADWITTEFNNGTNPATFAVVGAEVGGPGAGGPRAIVFK